MDIMFTTPSDIYERYLYMELLGEGKNALTMECIPIDKASDYACDDAFATLQLTKYWSEKLSEEEQAEIAETVPNAQFFGEAGSKLNEKRQKHYQLLEVTRSAPCTGSSGPASKAWVWPLAAFLLLISKKRK